MNKLEKFFEKLDSKERIFLLGLTSRVKAGDLQGLNIKKLEGETNVFRLKKGDFRIIYSKNGQNIDLISVTRRSEKTYRDF